MDLSKLSLEAVREEIDPRPKLAKLPRRGEERAERQQGLAEKGRDGQTATEDPAARSKAADRRAAGGSGSRSGEAAGAAGGRARCWSRGAQSRQEDAEAGNSARGTDR